MSAVIENLDSLTDPGTPRVSISHLSKYYDAPKRQRSMHSVALNDVSLEIEAGEMAVLLGPSGCGKTTLLRSIAGLEMPQHGEITLDGQTVYSAKTGTYIPPEKRNVSMVFQSYALWPNMSIRANLEFPAKVRKLRQLERSRLIEEIADTVGLRNLLDRYPGQLSGGQQQRAALARAIVAGNDIVLFDEPLSNVDAKIKDQIRRDIVSLKRRFGFSGVYVTHDQSEAAALADKLVVMDHGVIVQVGSPEDIYRCPGTRYVAEFMGALNIVRGTVVGMGSRGGHSLIVKTALGDIACTSRSGPVCAGTEVDVVFRVDACRFEASKPQIQSNTWAVEVLEQSFMGMLAEMQVRVATQGEQAPTVFSIVGAANGCSRAPRGWLNVLPEDMWVFNE